MGGEGLLLHPDPSGVMVKGVKKCRKKNTLAFFIDFVIILK
jgi:hypothetical protein